MSQQFKEALEAMEPSHRTIGWSQNAEPVLHYTAAQALAAHEAVAVQPAGEVAMRPMTDKHGRQAWYVSTPEFYCDIERDDQGRWEVFFREENGAEGFAVQPSGWKSLADSQWMNIVNHDRAFANFSKEDAVHLAVKMTEAKLRELNAVQPSVDAELLAVLQAQMHYPECWDTAAYTTFADALHEALQGRGCSTCDVKLNLRAESAHPLQELADESQRLGLWPIGCTSQAMYDEFLAWCKEKEAAPPAELRVRKFGSVTSGNGKDIEITGFVFDGNMANCTPEAVAHAIADHVLREARESVTFEDNVEVACAEREALRKALEALRSVNFDRRKATEEFERLGDLYYREFHRLRPGKDDPFRDSSDDENTKQFDAWSRKRVEAAIDLADAALSAQTTDQSAGGE